MEDGKFHCVPFVQSAYAPRSAWLDSACEQPIFQRNRTSCAAPSYGYTYGTSTCDGLTTFLIFGSLMVIAPTDAGTIPAFRAQADGGCEPLTISSSDTQRYEFFSGTQLSPGVFVEGVEGFEP